MILRLEREGLVEEDKDDCGQSVQTGRGYEMAWLDAMRGASDGGRAR